MINLCLVVWTNLFWEYLAKSNFIMTLYGLDNYVIWILDKIVSYLSIWISYVFNNFIGNGNWYISNRVLTND